MKEDSYAHCFNTGHTVHASFLRRPGRVDISWQCSQCTASDVDVISDDEHRDDELAELEAQAAAERARVYEQEQRRVVDDGGL